MRTFFLKDRKLEVGEITEAEMALMTGDIADGRRIKAVLDDWILISLRWRKKGEFEVIAVGVDEASGRWWMTSPVAVVEDACILTQNGSLYKLGPRPAPDDEGLEDRVRIGLLRWGYH